MGDKVSQQVIWCCSTVLFFVTHVALFAFRLRLPTPKLCEFANQLCSSNRMMSFFFVILPIRLRQSQSQSTEEKENTVPYFGTVSTVSPNRNYCVRSVLASFEGSSLAKALVIHQKPSHRLCAHSASLIEDPHLGTCFSSRVSCCLL